MAVSTVIIEEQAGRRRRVELGGGALPLQGANWSGLQLLATGWNPGNVEATQHVLGPQEVPSDWDFEWNTTRISRTPVNVSDPGRGADYTIFRAHQIAILLEDIFRGAVLLKVTWVSSAANQSQSSPRQTRVGRAQTWDFNYARPDDIEGTISFAWIGRGDRQPKASSIRGENVLATIQAAINAANAASNAIARSTLRNPERNQRPGATTFSLGDVEAIVNGPLETVDSFARAANSVSNRLKRIGDMILTVRETPAAIYGRVLDVANNGLSVATTFLDAMSREGPETQANRSKVSILTKTASYFSGAQTQAMLMAAAMEELAERARQRRSGLVSSAGTSRSQEIMRPEDSFQVHIPREGETMASIANKFYGSADLGDELSIANGLPSYTITPPKIPIIIPTRRNLEISTRNRV